MQLFNRENQVPVFSPDDVSIFDGESAEFASIKVFVVLRMRMTTYKLADINSLHSIVTERQADGQVADVLSLDDVKSLHNRFLHLKFFLDIRTADALL